MKNDDWSTPNFLFDSLNKVFNFTLDACASDLNHKCDKYYTINDNALTKSWKDNIVFCNPPYSNIKAFVEKANYECINNNVVTVMLLPARTDTIWFHEYIYQKYDVEFLRGRLRFSNSKENAPFPSMIVYFCKR